MRARLEDYAACVRAQSADESVAAAAAQVEDPRRHNSGGDLKAKKTEITVETFEVLLIKQRGGFRRGWCAMCDKHVALISMDEAHLSGLSTEAVQKEVQGGQIHLVETGGSTLICFNSLNRI